MFLRRCEMLFLVGSNILYMCECHFQWGPIFCIGVTVIFSGVKYWCGMSFSVGSNIVYSVNVNFSGVQYSLSV